MSKTNIIKFYRIIREKIKAVKIKVGKIIG